MLDKQNEADTSAPVYRAAARRFHWVTAAFVFILVPVGLYMVNRAAATNFDTLTNSLYSWHKLGGFFLLWLVLARLIYRLRMGAPPDEPSLENWQRVGAHVTHWGLYALLVAVPLLGWYGTSLYPALTVAGGLTLPALAAPNQPMSETVFFFHKLGAILLAIGIVAHVGAALFHHIIRKDNVLRRMLPGLRQR